MKERLSLEGRKNVSVCERLRLLYPNSSLKHLLYLYGTTLHGSRPVIMQHDQIRPHDRASTWQYPEWSEGIASVRALMK